jgi:hypothetical protein
MLRCSDDPLGVDIDHNLEHVKSGDEVSRDKYVAPDQKQIFQN